MSEISQIAMSMWCFPAAAFVPERSSGVEPWYEEPELGGVMTLLEEKKGPLTVMGAPVLSKATCFLSTKMPKTSLYAVPTYSGYSSVATVPLGQERAGGKRQKMGNLQTNSAAKPSKPSSSSTSIERTVAS